MVVVGFLLCGGVGGAMKDYRTMPASILHEKTLLREKSSFISRLSTCPEKLGSIIISRSGWGDFPYPSSRKCLSLQNAKDNRFELSYGNEGNSTGGIGFIFFRFVALSSCTPEHPRWQISSECCLSHFRASPGLPPPPPPRPAL